MSWKTNSSETDRVEFYHDQNPDATVGVYETINEEYDWYGQTRISKTPAGPFKHRKKFDSREAALEWLDSFTSNIVDIDEFED